MKKHSKILKDIRRSVGMLLAFIMIVSCGISVNITAAETLKIADTGKMIGMGYKPRIDDGWGGYEPEIVFQTYKKVVVEDPGDVSMSESPVLNATLYVVIGGREYEVMKYTSSPAYDSDYDTIGVFDLGDDNYKISMAPVYYYDEIYGYGSSEVDDRSYVEFDYCSGDTSESETVYCTYAKNWGFSDDIMEYLSGKGLDDWEDIMEYLTSKELSRNYVMKYTLGDSDGNTASFTQKNATLVDYDDYNLSAYLFGKRLGYNRIENLADYHDAGKFNHIKMFKGDIYVDADKLSELGGVLILPNDNNSRLFELNSVYVNDKVLYNDGYSKNIIKNGYNLLNCVLPYVVDTPEEAVDEFINIMTGKYFTMDDFENEDDYYSYDYSYSSINSEQGHIFKSGDGLIGIFAYNEYTYDDTSNPAEIVRLELMSYCDAYNDRESDDDKFMWASAVTPEIKVSGTECTDSQAYMNYLRKYIDYLQILDYSIDLGDSSYVIMYGDGAEYKVNLYQTMEILENIYYYAQYENCKDASEIPDYADYSYYDDNEGEWKFLQYNAFTSLVPINAEMVNEDLWLYPFSDISTEYGWVADADGIEDIITAAGLPKDSVKVWKVSKTETFEITSTAAQDLVDCLKNQFGTEAYEDFCTYIEEKFVTKSRNIEAFIENDSSQKNTDVDVYAEELKVPLSLLDSAGLGEENSLIQFWYAGNNIYYLLPYMDEYSTDEILYHGKMIGIRIGRHKAGSSFTGAPLEKLYSLKYDQLYCTELGTVKFAKIPSQIEVQDNIVTTANRYSLSWDVPDDNGAEILGYQIAVLPHRTSGVTEPSDDQYILVGEQAGSYTDLGDNYEIKYTTPDNSYVVETEGKSVDVFIRAVNVIGCGKPRKVSIVNEYDITIEGADSVKVGESSDYDTLNGNGINVEEFCTYQLKDNPKSVTIDSKGNLCVDKDCEIDKVIIVSTGKAGTDYEGRTAEKPVAIIKDSVDPGSGGVPPVGDDIPVVPLVLVSVLALAGAVLVFTRSKRV